MFIFIFLMETTKMWSYSIEFYIEMRYIQVTPLGSKTKNGPINFIVAQKKTGRTLKSNLYKMYDLITCYPLVLYQETQIYVIV